MDTATVNTTLTTTFTDTSSPIPALPRATRHPYHANDDWRFILYRLGYKLLQRALPRAAAFSGFHLVYNSGFGITALVSGSHTALWAYQPSTGRRRDFVPFVLEYWFTWF